MHFQELLNEITELKDHLRAVQQMVEMSMHNTRIRLMRLTIKISIIATSISTGGLIASNTTNITCATLMFCVGIFGMNLLSGLESAPYAFMAIVSGLGGLSLVTYTGLDAVYQKR